jgi:hypothetical protein
VILFECADENLKRRGSGALQLKDLLRNWGYTLHGFDPVTGEPVPLQAETEALNLVAAPEGVDLRANRRTTA